MIKIKEKKWFLSTQPFLTNCLLKWQKCEYGLHKFITSGSKAEHAVQSYAAGVGGLGTWVYGLYLQYADHMTWLHYPHWSKERMEKNQLTPNLR